MQCKAGYREHKYFTPEDFTKEEFERGNLLAIAVIEDGEKICCQCGFHRQVFEKFHINLYTFVVILNHCGEHFAIDIEFPNGREYEQFNHPEDQAEFDKAYDKLNQLITWDENVARLAILRFIEHVTNI